MQSEGLLVHLLTPRPDVQVMYLLGADECDIPKDTFVVYQVSCALHYERMLASCA